ncbi:alpha/beta fold hydrolase [Streptomyces sp. NPDC001658]
MTPPAPTHLTTPDGTRIAYRDRPPPHPHPAPHPVLLLHGLAGHQGEFDDLASRLHAAGHRVVSYDARGHGASTLRPPTVTRAAHVQDAVTLIEELALAPVTLIGQSLGGHTAMLLASARPDLVSSLVLVEAGPAGSDPGLPSLIAEWLDGWDSGTDRDTMVACVAELATRDYWDEWSRVACPTLLIEGANGTMRPDEPSTMLARRPTGTRHVVVPGAAHDVHLDQPEALYGLITSFLA